MLNLVLLLIFVIVAAAVWYQGLWGGAITLINLFLAAMLAFNYFEPVADLIDAQDASFTYLVDFLALWGLFVLAFGLLRLLSDVLSRTRVMFDFWTETIGRSLVALWVAWLFIGFVCATMHTAPLGPHPLGFQPAPTAGNFLGMAPGKQWLAFMQSRSRGAFSRGEADASKQSPVAADEGLDARVFDPQSRFVLKYYQRRQNFADEPKYRVAR
jgi:hypothetical protein